MRALSFMYHDVRESSTSEKRLGSEPTAARYRLDRTEFEAHVAALSQQIIAPPMLVHEALQGEGLQGWSAGPPVMLTFDDGYLSAKSVVLDVLARYGWRAHFFITTDYIGKTNYLTPADIRLLKSAGHLIGTHTRSHPAMMSALNWDAMVGEWRDSVAVLEDILGGAVIAGSVPGGFYSPQVAKAGSLVGLRALFTSVPTSCVRAVNHCRVFGRHAILAGMPREREALLAQNRLFARSRVRAAWMAKQVAKGLLGSAYLQLRQRAMQWLAQDCL